MYVCTYAQGAAADEEADVTGRHFGQFGGRYIPETLVEAHKQLEEVRAYGARMVCVVERSKIKREWTGS